MRTVALLVVCALASSARAQPMDPPSQTLARAVKLYDRKDFYSASIELQKVVSGQTGDTQPNVQRAELFLAKTLYQMGFYAVAWSRLASIVQAQSHAYRDAAPKWIVAILRVAPSPTVRSALFVFRESAVIDDPTLASVRDEFAYQLGRELAIRDIPKAEAFAMLAKVPPSSPFAARAQLEIARAKLRANDIHGGIAAAMIAGRSSELTVEAAHVIATWTHIHPAAAEARAPLRELAPASAYARYQLSRALLDGKPELPGLDRVTASTFDAVMLPSACRGSWPDDIKPIARTVLGEARPVVAKLLGNEDNAELFEWVRELQSRPPAPGTDVVIAAMSDAVMRERIGWYEEVNKELAAVQRADRAWQTTQVAADVLQELTLIQALEASDIGANARQRLQLLARDLDVLDKVLASASPAFALSAGPDVELGHGLVIAGELCRAGGGTAPTMATPSRTAHGCAGCSTREASWSFLVLAALVLARISRRARPRSSARGHELHHDDAGHGQG